MKGGWPVHPKFFPDFHSFHQQPSVLRGEGGTAEEREGRCLCFLLSVQRKAALHFARFQSADWAAARQGDAAPGGKGFCSGAGRFCPRDGPVQGSASSWRGRRRGTATCPGPAPERDFFNQTVTKLGSFLQYGSDSLVKKQLALGLVLPGAAGNRCLAAAQASSGALLWSWSQRPTEASVASPSVSRRAERLITVYVVVSGKLGPGAEFGMTVEVDAVSKLSHPVYDYLTILRERKAKNNYKSKPRC